MGGLRFRAGPVRPQFWLLLLLLACTPLAAAQSGEGFRSLSEIEAALNPLDVLANHDGVRRSIDLRIRFRNGSALLEEEASRQLQVLGEALQGSRLAGYDFRILGHTNALGSDTLNQTLSEARAAAVRQHLIDGYGIEAARLLAEGRGEAELLDGLDPNSAEHRRVEIVAVPRAQADPFAVEPANESARTSGSGIRW